MADEAKTEGTPTEAAAAAPPPPPTTEQVETPPPAAAEQTPTDTPTQAPTEAPKEAPKETPTDTPAGAEAAEAPAGATEATPDLLGEYRATNQSAFVVGASGECGKALLKELARTKVFSKVISMGRRELKLEDEVYNGFAVEQKIVDFDKLEESVDAFKGPTVGFCCLGTTRGKAGVEGFKKVDHDYTMKVAELAKANGCKHYHLVSSTGANKNSSMLYPKVKGQVEEETTNLGFDRLSIYRPGLLMCNRDEFRFGEWLARKVMTPVDYLNPGGVTNTTISIAKAMIARTVKPVEEKTEILGGKAIFKASKEIAG